MTKFIVHLSEKQRELMDEDFIRSHVDYLRRLKAQDVLPFCGPSEDGTAIVILSCDTREEAKRLVDGDPFSQVNYYTDRRIVEVEEATPENDFLLQEVLGHME